MNGIWIILVDPAPGIRQTSKSTIVHVASTYSNAELWVSEQKQPEYAFTIYGPFDIDGHNELHLKKAIDWHRAGGRRQMTKPELLTLLHSLIHCPVCTSQGRALCGRHGYITEQDIKLLK